MKKLVTSFKKWMDRHLVEISVFLATITSAIALIVFIDIKNTSKQLLLLKENGDLMMENVNLKLINGQQINLLERQQIYLQQQRVYIRDLERFKEAILKGNYTKNETKNLRQTNIEVVER